MIVVAGEALIDLVIDPDGSVDARRGGAPYNTARAVARLGSACRFVGGLSNDRFGTELLAELTADGVDASAVSPVAAPTTLAAAEIDATGSASYRFYIDGTSAPLLPGATLDAALDPAPTMFFTGGLALLLQPMADSVTAAVAGLPDATLFVLDVNCRPSVIGDDDRYRTRLNELLRRADVVKVSDEDLMFLAPELAPNAAAALLIERGARTVVITAGSSITTIVDADGASEVPVPPIAGPIVDTIGAGDTFGAGILASLDEQGIDRSTLDRSALRTAVELGHAAAGVVVTRRGANPPRRDELPG